jgi:hypothetical protein
MEARPNAIRRIAPLVVSAALVGCLVALPASVNAGSSSVAQSAKKCKKHKRYAVAARKKCKKKRAVVVPPYQPAPPLLAPASLSISPTDKDFGVVSPGDSSPQTFTVTNSGGSPSGALSSSLGGANPSSFGISSDTCNGIALGAGSTCTLDVHCTTVDANNSIFTATVTVTGYPGGYPSATLRCTETT